MGGDHVVSLWEEGPAAAPPPAGEPDRAEPLLCDGWEGGELVLEEGALWLYGSGTAELELEAPAPTLVSVYADGRAVEPVLVADRTRITVEIPNEGWHPFVVRAAPGLRLVAARFR